MHDALTRLREPVRGLRSILLVAALAAGSASFMAVRHSTAPTPSRPTPSEPVHCIELAAPVDPVSSALEPIVLEHRWLIGTFASAAEVDAALGTTIEPWQPFTYMFDSQPRAAIAGDIYPSNEWREHEFGRDEHGGIWLVRNATHPMRARFNTVTYTRDIYLLPIGSSFRGVR